MKPSLTVNGGAPGVRAETAPAAVRAVPRPKEQDYGLNLHFFGRMKPQRVYPLTVEVGRGLTAVGRADTGVLVRPVIPGALVVPAEQSLDLGRPGEAVTFHVTPLARGRLPEARVEVVRHGRPIRQLPLSMAADTQRLTWVLLLLALVLPTLLLYFTKYNPPQGLVPGTRLRWLRPLPPDRGDPKPPEMNPGPAVPAGPGDACLPPPAEASRWVYFQDVGGKNAGPGDKKEDQVGEARPPAGAGPELVVAAPPTPAAQVEEYLRPGQPDEVLRHRLEVFLNGNVPAFPGSRTLFGVLGAAVGHSYRHLREWNHDIKPAFVLGFALSAAAFFSWTSKRPRRYLLEAAVTLPTPAAQATRLDCSSETRLVMSPPEAIPAEPAE